MQDTHNSELQYNEELVSIPMDDSLSQKEKVYLFVMPFMQQY